jgi:hypothetical protein
MSRYYRYDCYEDIDDDDEEYKLKQKVQRRERKQKEARHLAKMRKEARYQYKHDKLMRDVEGFEA